MGTGALLSGNNPVKYVDPDGRFVFLGGSTVTAGTGAGGSIESGIIISKDKSGNYQVGSYQISGGGFLAGMGTSATISGSWAPNAQKISDLEGLTITVGASAFGVKGFLGGGLDVNIPVDGKLKNFSVSGHIGGGTPGVESHSFATTTTTSLYGEGTSLSEAWNNAKNAGLFDTFSEDFINHFKIAYTNATNEEILE